MTARTPAAALLLATLTSCGGTWSVGDCDCFASSFLIWPGNHNGDQVTDASHDMFAFQISSGCLYNFQTGRENPNFCVAVPGDRVVYRGLQMRIANVRTDSGNCIAALLEAATSRFIEIELDPSETEIAVITESHPDLCVA